MKNSVNVVILGGSPTGLYALRELAGAGFDVAVADTSAGCASRSSLVRHRERRFVGSLEEIKAWLWSLRDRCDEAPILLPTSDVFIEFLSQHFDELATAFRIFSCYERIAGELLDKEAFHRLCVRHGIPVPGVWRAESVRDLRNLADVIPYPCILKPLLIHRARSFLRGGKLIVVNDRHQFITGVSTIPRESGEWLVQEIIPGPESEITLFGGYIDASGGSVEAFTGRKLRQYPIGFGSASLVSSEPCEETRSLSERFLAEIGFRGVCGSEFKRDPRDGILKIIEINPRPTLWFQITHDAGLRVVEAACRDLAELAFAPSRRPQDDKVRWRYLAKDVVSKFSYSRHGTRFILPAPVIPRAAASTRSWPVFSWRDPWPALVEPLLFTAKAWDRRRRRRSG